MGYAANGVAQVKAPMRFFDIQEETHQDVMRKGEGKSLLTSLEGVVIHSLNESTNRSFEVDRVTIIYISNITFLI